MTRAQRSEGCAAGDCGEAGESDAAGLAKGAAQPRSGAPRPFPGLSKEHISALLRKRKATIEAYAGASYLKVTVQGDRTHNTPPKRNAVTTFSAASRRRLLDTLAKIRRDAVPFFVTLTYPDHFPIYRADYKSHLDLLGQRLRRRWPGASVIWKLEFKERKSGTNAGKLAPHYHLFVFGVPWAFPFVEEHCRRYRLEPKRFAGSAECWWLTWVANPAGETMEDARHGCGETADDPLLPDEPVGRDDLKQWMSRVWYDVVDSGEVRHFRAGTRVERLRTIAGAFRYASKGYMGKEIEVADLPASPGRFWGAIGRSCLPKGDRTRLLATGCEAFQVLRWMRRLLLARSIKNQPLHLGSTISRKLYCHADRWLAILPKVLASDQRPVVSRPLSGPGGQLP